MPAAGCDRPGHGTDQAGGDGTDLTLKEDALHSDTQQPIVGFTIPDWVQIVAEVKLVAQTFPASVLNPGTPRSPPRRRRSWSSTSVAI